jgi:hypothetical protein
MSNLEDRNFSNPSDAEEITEIGESEEELPATRPKAGFGPPHPHLAFLGEDLFSVHLALTAPDREPLIPKMTDVEFRESSVRLFNELAPRNAVEGMLATLAVAAFNASLGAIADGSRQDIPPHIRDLDLRRGLRGASIAANLITTYRDMRSGGRKSVSVGKVNVEAGGQAIVGHVEARRKRTKHP